MGNILSKFFNEKYSLDESNNNLYEINIPNNIFYLTCYRNHINNINIKQNIEILECDLFVRLNNINNTNLHIYLW